MKEAPDPVIRVLLVDDDYDLAEENQRALATQPDATFLVTICHDGHKAIQAVAEQPQGFDVALVDYYLNDPDLNGITVMRRLFEYNPSLPVILFTGRDRTGDDLGTGAITEGAYHYVSLPKGSRINVIAAHCRMAVRDRANRRRLLAEEVSHALQQTRDIEAVLTAYVEELDHLGYKAGAIYLHAPGWIIGDVVGPGMRYAKQHEFLRRERVFNAPGLPLFYDLSEPTRIEGVLRQDQAVALYQTPEGDTYITIPLRDQVSKDRLLGAVLLGPHPDTEPDEEETDVLGRLGHQMALAVRNAVDFRQLNYSSTVWDAILEMNRAIQPLLDQPGARQQILDKVASTIATALGFRRVVISVLRRDRAELCGIFGLTAAEEADCRNVMTPVSELQKLDQEFYRFESSSSYFIPEGSYDFAQFGGYVLDAEQHEGPPWAWHEGDQLRTRVQNAQGDTLAYIAADERRTGRPGEGTVRAMEIFATRLADLLETMTGRRYQQAMIEIKTVSDRFNQITDRQELFETIHYHLALLMDAEKIKIGLYNAPERMIELAYQQGEPEALSSLSVEEGLMGYIVRTGEALLFSTEQEITQFCADQQIAILGQQASSWIGVPIQSDSGETVGVMALENTQGAYSYDELDQHILYILSDSVASALRRIAAEQERDQATIAALIEALDAPAAELVGATVSIREVEQRILDHAAQLTNADCGAFLHFDSKHDQLVVTPEDWYVRDRTRDRALMDTRSYPLAPPDDQPTTLTVQAVKSHRVRKWDDVTQERDYVADIPGMRSLIAMPVFISDAQGRERLFGVWTLQAHEPRAFTDDHIKLLEAFSRFAIQAVQRVHQQEQNEKLLLLTERYRSTVVLRHLLPNLIRGLHNTYALADHTLRQLEGTTYDLAAEAHRHAEVGQYRIEKGEWVCLNQLAREVLANYEVPGGMVRIEPDFYIHLSEEAAAYGNRAGLEEVLTILLDNAYGKLRDSERSRRLRVTTDSEPDGSLVLRLFNSGPPLRKDVADFLAGSEEWDTRYESLAQARLLLSLYGATLLVTHNDIDGVEFTLCWPQPDRELAGDPLPPDLHRRLDHVRRAIARRQALRFASHMARRGSQLAPLYDPLLASLRKADASVSELKAALEDDPLVCEMVDVLDLVSKVRESVQGLISESYITLRCPPSRRTTPLVVWTNRNTLSMVLHNLIDNAVREINKGASAAGGRHREVITLNVKTTKQEVLISVRNTGSMVDPALQALLGDQPVPQETGHGMGLYHGKVLLRHCGGNLLLTQNDLEQGVVFTIYLKPHHPGPARGGTHYGKS